ncbi:MAG: Fe-S oxidoreductase [Candidatus Scalindua rubra]|uniref:Fe-S oxidoreductase n=1 Tax=Candidatus Scalindua rubra TaxID=1872076 RepID=A0A1E3X401_9BACT|nr:MAG: Fe-S oxidoreductase [Candidatus Scalindua rubra]
MIRYGVESGSEFVLEKIRKNITLDEVEEAFRLTKNNGIQALGGFMFGFPWDSKESIEKTLSFVKRLSPDQVQFSICMAYPGTSIYDYAQKENLILAKDWKEFDMTYGPVVKTIDMPRDELKNILARAYKEFYFRPRFFLQTLLNIRDFYELKRVVRSMISLIRTILLHSG